MPMTPINRQSQTATYPHPDTIRRLRRAAGYTSQAALAKRLGVCPRTVQHLEEGTRRMSNVLMCIRFAQACNVSLWALLGAEEMQAQ
jgi:transcriptional regulator with XRE-family HTH domain